MINHYTLNWTWQTGGSGWVKLGSGQVRLIGLRVKTGSGQSRFGSGRVGLTHIFHMNFFKKKKTCICHLESHATNYLM